ncbi:MAG: restriction endonuclease subunit S [Halanaerobiales bacterium]|nr:restriction endonuclease subunit S [Halanaerobiales bacterium]
MIGEFKKEYIPYGWKFGKFEDVLEGFSSGATPRRNRSEYYNGNIKWVTSGELNYNVITDTLEKITIEGKSKTNLKLLPSGTFLMAITGLEAAGTRGSCAILGVEATTNQSCMALYFTKKLTTNYLFHYYTFRGNELALKYCQGTKQQSYTGKIVRILPILFPENLEEQQVIATALTDIDTLITSLEKLIDKKQRIKQGTMQQFLTKKKRLPGFTGEWEVKRLGEIANIETGSTPPTNDLNNYGNEYLFVSPADLGNSKYIKETEKRLSLKGFSLSRKFSKNSILFTCIGSTIGKSGIAPFELTSNQQINAILPNETYSTEYVYYMLKHLSLKIKSSASVQAVPIINKSTFEFIQITIPSLAEQQAIAQILSDMDSEIESLEEKLAKYKAIKQGMMQELLTGRIRLI